MFKINDSAHSQCLNCGAEIAGNYCSNCGQKKIKPYHTFWYLVQEFLGNYFSFDSKFAKTIYPLVFKPGFLTNEYRQGRRTNFIPPIRLYVFISIVFFLVFINLRRPELNIGFNTPIIMSDVRMPDSLLSSTSNDSAIVADFQGMLNSMDSFNVNGKTYPNFESIAEFEAYVDVLPESEKPNWFSIIIIRQSIKMLGIEPEEMNKAVLNQFLDNLPKVIFILLPVFALIYKLLYIRRNYFYEEHFIFSIHFHSFLFIMLLLMIPISYLWSGIWFLSLVIPAIYLFFAMKRVFNQTKFKTTMKLFSVMILYAFVLLIAFGVNIVLSAFAI